MHKLLDGYARFRTTVFPKRAELFHSLAESQKPSTLFITCADSRVVPDMITQSNPGDLFICRNAGNIVPAYGDTTGGVTATIEYAVMALGVENIIVCGHSDCGAMKAVLSGKKHEGMPAVDAWLKHSAMAMEVLRQHDTQDNNELQLVSSTDRLRALTRANVMSQLAHLQTHPSVAAKLANGRMNLYGWVYEIHSGQIQSYDPAVGRFLELPDTKVKHLPVSVQQPRLQLMVS